MQNETDANPKEDNVVVTVNLPDEGNSTTTEPSDGMQTVTENIEVGENKDTEKEQKEVLPSLGILPDVDPSNNDNFEFLEASACSLSSQNQAASPPDPSDIIYKVKKIKWHDNEVSIITQNNNGPCPLIAILNAMTLKGKICLPKDRQEFSGGELVLILGNAVFDVPRSSVPSEMRRYLEQNTEDAVCILHKLQTGLDVNVRFSGVRDFEFTSEVSLFDVLEVPLYHGWVIDPVSEAAPLVSTLSYNQLTNNIISWREEAEKSNDDTLLLKAMLCEEFISESVSQLTIYGLFELGAVLQDQEVGVLFRNNHFSTIFKRKGRLYQLLTDQGFLLEAITWETLTDIDATFSEFVDATFEPLPQDPQGSNEPELSKEQQIESDHQLAAMLQQEAERQKKKEEDFSRIVDDLGLRDLPDEEIARRLQDRENQINEEQQSVSNAQSESESADTATGRSSSLPRSKSNSDSDSKRKKDCTIL